jgi:hypothetical protein
VTYQDYNIPWTTLFMVILGTGHPNPMNLDQRLGSDGSRSNSSSEDLETEGAEEFLCIHQDCRFGFLIHPSPNKN